MFWFGNLSSNTPGLFGCGGSITPSRRADWKSYLYPYPAVPSTVWPSKFCPAVKIVPLDNVE